MKSIDLKPGDRVRILSELDQPEAIVRTVLENGNYYLEGRFCEYLSTNLMPCEEWDQLQSETLTVKRCVVEEDKKFEITPDRSMISNLPGYKKFISEVKEKYYV